MAGDTSKILRNDGRCATCDGERLVKKITDRWGKIEVCRTVGHPWGHPNMLKPCDDCRAWMREKEQGFKSPAPMGEKAHRRTKEE